MTGGSGIRASEEVVGCLDAAEETLEDLAGHVVDVVSVRKPIDEAEAKGWLLTISKLSPLVGNMLEFEFVRRFNELDLPDTWQWERQDPSFPDAGLMGPPGPTSGIEIKAWFPLATEMTGRFRESQRRLEVSDVRLAVVAWLPEYLIAGKPRILGVFIDDGLAVAQARDSHYFDPPRYLVLEPNDTTARTANLRQTVTSGHRIQETGGKLEEAIAQVNSWDPEFRDFGFSDDHQRVCLDLAQRFSYRIDTNFAKIDRINHPPLEKFKKQVLALRLLDRSLNDWVNLIKSDSDEAVAQILESMPEKG